MNLLLLSIAFIICSAVCSIAFMGIGSLVLRSFGQESHPINSFSFGLGTTIGILEIYNFIRPIDSIISIILCLAGAIGFATEPRLRRSIVSAIQSSEPELLAAFIGALFLVALRASGPCTHYDTGLYGAPSVRWLVTYPIVPGLANLQGRLGFDSSLFLYAAALHHGIFTDFSYRIMNGLLILAVTPFVFSAGSRLLRGKTNSTGDWFLWILVIPLGFSAAEADIVGTNTDLPVTMMCLLAANFLFSVFEDGDPAGGKEEVERRRLLTATLLFALVVSFKLSIVVFAAVAWVIAFVKLQFFTTRSREQKLASILAVASSSFILVPWFCRNMILSGYPFYPNSSFGIRADWSVPKASADLAAAGVRSWARIPHASLSETAGYSWISPWFHTIRTYRGGFAVPATLLLVGLFLLMLASHRNKRPIHKGLILLIPSLLGLIFWFFQAPAIRFGEAVIWVTAATAGGCGIASFLSGKSLGWRRSVVVFILAASAWCLYPRSLWTISFQPLAEIHGYDPLPVWDVFTKNTRSGLEVHLPKSEDKCWDAPLPCAAYFNDTLRLRDPGDIRKGFASHGFPKDAEWIGQVQAEGPANQ